MIIFPNSSSLLDTNICSKTSCSYGWVCIQVFRLDEEILLSGLKRRSRDLKIQNLLTFLNRQRKKGIARETRVEMHSLFKLV